MSEQEKEKVLHGLNSCSEYIDGIPNICDITECPYRVVAPWCTQQLARDAEKLIRELLKAHEPRVMTLEEVRDEAEYMYLEKYSKTGSDLYECAIPGDWDRYGIELLMSAYDAARLRWSDYGKTWRCWSSRPTDVQRKAVKWDG